MPSAHFSLSDCPQFEDWAFFREEALRGRAIQALERVVHEKNAAGDYAAAAVLAGRLVAFDYRPAERSEIFIADYAGGQPRLLPTNPGANNVVPSWSRDGQWVYFASSRGNEAIQVWKAHYPDGRAIRLTKNGGVYPIESADGFLYYSKTLDSDEIWKISLDGGPESLVLKAPGLSCFCNWALAPAGIYVITERLEQPRTISFYDFESKKVTEVLRLEKYAINPAVSPDGKSLIYVQMDQNDHTIMLLNHFH